MDTVRTKAIYGNADSRYLKVYLEDSRDTNLFLGHGTWRTEGWVEVENNLVNQMLLGIYESKESLPLKYGAGLADYQVRDVSYMLALSSVLNRNPMGLGKTVETVSLLRELGITRALIIVPKPCITQWIATFRDWYMDAEVSSNIDADGIIVTNYEQVTGYKNLPKLRDGVWQYLIVDEAHRLKNRKSKRTMAIKSIPAVRKLAITGTPVLRRLDDLWSILNFLDWRYSGLSYWNFVNYFCQVTDGFWGKEITGVTDDPLRLELLHTLLKEISVYNSVEVAHGKRVVEILLTMEKAQRTLYDKLRKLVLDELPRDCTIPNGAVLTTRLRQVTSYPGSIDKEKKDFVGIKFMWIKEFMDDNPEKKVCIFTKFETAARALNEYLNKHNISCVSYTGKVANEVRIMNKKLFLSNPDIRAFVGTIDAVGQGFDGLQDVCSVSIFLDKDFSPKINEQVEDRLHRRGQSQQVQIYYLTCEKSFDERVGKINISKANDIRKALEDEDSDSI